MEIFDGEEEFALKSSLEFRKSADAKRYSMITRLSEDFMNRHIAYWKFANEQLFSEKKIFGANFKKTLKFPPPKFPSLILEAHVQEPKS